jgi:hypothetical protein
MIACIDMLGAIVIDGVLTEYDGRHVVHHESWSFCFVADEVLEKSMKPVLGGTRKIRNTTLTQVIDSNTYNKTVRAQRDSNSPCK